MKLFYLILFLSPFSLPAQSQVRLNILSFGAKGDGHTLDTRAIQSAIDSAYAAGGGRVTLPAGSFLSGSLYLKSRVELHLEAGAILLGSSRRPDYKKINWYALLLADGEEDIAITGSGTIDGQGAALAADVVARVKSGEIIDPYWAHDRPHERERPQIIEFACCKRVRVQGVFLKNSACWVQTYDHCEDLTIDGIRVESMAYWNNDGIDLVDCRRARVRDCRINSADDGICIKSTFPPPISEDIRIERCTIRSSASAFKLGTSSHGGFRNIRVRDLTVYDTYRSAIALEIVDGGVLEDVDIQGVRATNTGNAIFIRLGNRFVRRGPGRLKGVRIRDVYAEIPDRKPDAGYPFEGPPVAGLPPQHNLIPSSITGLPGHPVQDISLENVEIVFAGSVHLDVPHLDMNDLDKVPERPSDYPDFSMFGELPAWGFYVRHAEGLRFKNVRLRLSGADFRPVLVLDDVRDMELKNVLLQKRNTAPVLVQREVRGLKIKRLRQ